MLRSNYFPIAISTINENSEGLIYRYVSAKIPEYETQSNLHVLQITPVRQLAMKAACMHTVAPVRRTHVILHLFKLQSYHYPRPRKEIRIRILLYVERRAQRLSLRQC
jgi:hypothetical protein